MASPKAGVVTELLSRWCLRVKAWENAISLKIFESVKGIRKFEVHWIGPEYLGVYLGLFWVEFCNPGGVEYEKKTELDVWFLFIEKL